MVFQGVDSNAGRELLAVNSSGAVRVVADLNPGIGGTQMSQFTAAGSKIYFVAQTQSYGAEIYVTDGTSAGTQRVSNLPDTVGSSGAEAGPMIVAAGGGKAFFTLSPPIPTCPLYGTAGSLAETTLLPVTFTTLPAAGSMAVYNGKLFFSYKTASTGIELWTSDGTIAGTQLFADLRPGAGSSSPQGFQVIQDKLYFFASPGYGSGRMVTDGTVAGTKEDFNVYPVNTPRTLNGSFIVSSNGVSGVEPAAFDPLDGTYTLLAEVNPDSPPINVSGMSKVGGFVYFGRDSEIWRTDGSAIGTSFVANSQYAGARLAPDGQVLLFTPTSVLISDGTPAGTHTLATFTGLPAGYEVIGNRIVLLTYLGGNTYRLYGMDLTPGGAMTQLLEVGRITMGQLVNGGTAAYFSYRSDGVTHVVKSDGSQQGTLDLSFLPQSTGFANGYFPIGGTADAAYFAYNNGGNRIYIYRVDGTEAGSYSVYDTIGNNFSGAAIFNGNIYILADDKLLKSDGSPARATQVAMVPGTVPLYDLARARAAALPDRLIFIAADPSSSNAAIWQSDGTTAGTQFVATLPAPLSGVTTPRNLVATQDRVYMDAGSLVFVTNGASVSTESGIDGADLATNRAVLGNAIISFQRSGHFPLLRISSSLAGGIDGLIFNDTDADGQKDPDEEPLALQQVFMDLNGNDLLDVSEPVQFSRADGGYHFGGLPAGSYAVRVIPPASWVQTTPTANVSLSSGELRSGVHFGLHKPGTSSVPALQQSRLVLSSNTPQVQLRFSEDIGSIDVAGMTLTRTDDGAVIAVLPANVMINNDWNRLEIQTSTLNLSDGNYRLQVASNALHDLSNTPLASNVTFDFFILSGDANHDRKIDAVDLGILSTNWQGTSKTFSQGDFNYDGKVDIKDLAILAAHWQQTLLPPPPAVVVSTALTSPVKRAPGRVATLVI